MQVVAPAVTSYHSSDLSRLSTGAASLLRWLSRWFTETEEPLFPSTGYIARKQKRSERTVYRWLAELRSFGCIATETTPGIERRIVPQVAPEDCPKPRRRAVRAGKVSGVLSGVVSGALSLLRDASTEKRQQQEQPERLRPDLLGAAPGSHVSAAPMNPELTGLVAELAAVGVSASTARTLLASHGEEVCRLQLAALPHRKAADRSAVLVASIKGQWAIPEQVQKSAQKAQKAAVRAIQADEREKHRAGLLERFQALPQAAQEQIQQRALTLWRQEQPQAARIMQGKPSAAGVVRAYALRILEEGWTL